MITAQLYNQLKQAASNGRFTFSYSFPWKEDLTFLESNGFELLPQDPKSLKTNYLVSWEKATVIGDIQCIDLSSPTLTQAQKLWVIAQLTKKTKTKQ